MGRGAQLALETEGAETMRPSDSMDPCVDVEKLSLYVVIPG